MSVQNLELAAFAVILLFLGLMHLKVYHYGTFTLSVLYFSILQPLVYTRNAQVSSKQGLLLYIYMQ